MATSIQGTPIVSLPAEREARAQKLRASERLKQHVDDLPSDKREGAVVQYHFAVMCLCYFQLKQKEGCKDYDQAIPALRKITAHGPSDPAPLWVEVGVESYSQMYRQSVPDMLSTLADAFNALTV